MLYDIRWAACDRVWVIIETEDVARDMATCPVCHGMRSTIVINDIDYACLTCGGSGVVPFYKPVFVVEGPASVLGATIRFDVGTAPRASVVYMVQDSTGHLHYVPEDMVFPNKVDALAYVAKLA